MGSFLPFPLLAFCKKTPGFLQGTVSTCKAGTKFQVETKVDYNNCICEMKIEKTKLISNNNRRYYYSFIKVLITTSPHYIAALKITEYSSNEYKIGQLFIYGSNLILHTVNFGSEMV